MNIVQDAASSTFRLVAWTQAETKFVVLQKAVMFWMPAKIPPSLSSFGHKTPFCVGPYTPSQTCLMTVCFSVT
jgi:hypothetical protein